MSSWTFVNPLAAVCLLALSTSVTAIPAPPPMLHNTQISGNVTYKQKSLAYAPVEIRVGACDGAILATTKTDTRGNYAVTLPDVPVYETFFVTTPPKASFAATCSKGVNFTASNQKRSQHIAVPVAKPAPALLQLQAAENLWKQKRPYHYAYNVQRSCFCPEEYRKPIRIRVLNGKIQQAKLLPEGIPLSSSRQAEAIPVEGLFRIIRDAINNNAARVDVKYDPQLGFPTSIAIDHNQMIADEETYISTNGFKILGNFKPYMVW